MAYLLISVSKPFFTVDWCSCPRGKSLSLRTNLQVLVLVLVLGLQVLSSDPKSLSLFLSLNHKSLTTTLPGCMLHVFSACFAGFHVIHSVVNILLIYIVLFTTGGTRLSVILAFVINMVCKLVTSD